MSNSRAAGVYRRMLRLYPRGFRDEYGDDMVQLLSDQLHDEPSARVWLRTFADLAVTAPTRHLEAHMNRPSTNAAPLGFGAIALAGLLLAAVAGTSSGIVAAGLAVAAGSGVLAVLSYRQVRPVAARHPITEQWWKLLAFGAVAILGLVIVTSVIGDLPHHTWYLAMIVLLTGLVTIAMGVLLGIAHLGSAVRSGRAP